ncbi:MAG: hypothetical protein U9Q34_06090, partial [Elusimicrobiota bacterium]|nr:hypothetical protein [Elusimicrobiota bacterium]
MKILSDKMIKTLMMSLMGMVFFFISPLHSEPTQAPEVDISSDTADTVKFLEFEKKMIEVYEAKISSGNPAIADIFLANDRLKQKYLKIDKKKASLLIAKSRALVDLNKIFDFVWTEDNFNKLSDALGERINDKENILCSMGFGPQPEKLLPWVKKHRADYKKENVLIVKKAIREWDIVFSTSIDKINVDWAQARGRSQKTITKAKWDTWNIRQRNAAVDKLLPTERWKNYADLIDYSENTNGMIKKYKEKDKVVKDVEVFLSTG